MKEKQTSSLRRIDNLGRIVLPKEIRQKFHLTEKSEVVVKLDGEKIIITAFNKLDSIENILNKIVNCFDKDFKVLFCSQSKILSSNFNPQNKEKLFEILQKQEKLVLYGDDKIKFFESQKTMAVFPIFSQGDCLGSLVLLSPKFVQNFDFVVPILKLIELCFLS